MFGEAIRIHPPLYLVSAGVRCWRCGAAMPVVALMAPNVAGAEGEICLLSDIRQLPQSVLAAIRSRFPSFKRTYSKTSQSASYANTCPKCGVLSGDFYLHSEPGAPFFPTSAKEARTPCVHEIPLPGAIAVCAGIGVGVGVLILQNARRIAAP